MGAPILDQLQTLPKMNLNYSEEKKKAYLKLFPFENRVDPDQWASARAF